jgi:hypothetical protein
VLKLPMGNLFPDDLEYPNHQPLRSALRVRPRAVLVPLTFSIAASAFAPHHEFGVEDSRHDHVPEREYEEIVPAQMFLASGVSSSSGNQAWSAARSFDAADAVIRPARYVQDARPRFVGDARILPTSSTVSRQVCR